MQECAPQMSVAQVEDGTTEALCVSSDLADR